MLQRSALKTPHLTEGRAGQSFATAGGRSTFKHCRYTKARGVEMLVASPYPAWTGLPGQRELLLLALGHLAHTNSHTPMTFCSLSALLGLLSAGRVPALL